MPNTVNAYTDGACKGNPGPGGWGALIEVPGMPPQEIYGGEVMTTNNRMEMLGAINALKLLPASSKVRLTTDSQYVIKGINEWLPGWKKNGWRTSKKEPVKNGDLWQALDAARAGHDIDWVWVRGHTGHPGNERADQLANKGVVEFGKAS
ncbi:ribonuclease HI [Pseudomonas serbica]|jgi:ribonuclease HI|uniref:ribonuclease HI n=1 Tax=Pseudomonas serbica TaxID=2965074 RepID=UPI00237A77C1|nr:ribonuclease HI [Pseudomonas serbica]